MARTKNEILDSITTRFMANQLLASLYGYQTGSDFKSVFSLSSLEYTIFEIVAFAILFHEQMFDQHKIEVDEKLFNQKSGRIQWYRNMALLFQYGFDLVTDRDYFDNGNATDEQIANSKIIKYAAVSESKTESRVIIKIAGEIDGILSPLAIDQKNSFEEYIEEIKWAGVAFTVINYLPDRLLLKIQIKRDALVLTETGQSILDANYPVNDAITEFMKELPFDGEFRINNLIERLRKLSGVLDATILSAQSSWINPSLNGYGDYQPIYISAVPESGYYQVVNFENITYGVE